MDTGTQIWLYRLLFSCIEFQHNHNDKEGKLPTTLNKRKFREVPIPESNVDPEEHQGRAPDQAGQEDQCHGGVAGGTEAQVGDGSRPRAREEDQVITHVHAHSSYSSGTVSATGGAPARRHAAESPSLASSASWARMRVNSSSGRCMSITSPCLASSRPMSPPRPSSAHRGGGERQLAHVPLFFHASEQNGHMVAKFQQLVFCGSAHLVFRASRARRRVLMSWYWTSPVNLLDITLVGPGGYKAK